MPLASNYFPNGFQVFAAITFAANQDHAITRLPDGRIIWVNRPDDPDLTTDLMVWDPTLSEVTVQGQDGQAVSFRIPRYTTAQLPAVDTDNGTTKGRIAFVTDSNTFQIDTGVAWQSVSIFTILGVAAGGTGVDTFTAGYVKSPGGTSPFTTIAVVPIGEGGTGAITSTAARQAIFDPIFDAKGDIVVASAADTAVRFSIGADGKVLRAMAADTTGLRWEEAQAQTRGYLFGMTLDNNTTDAVNDIDIAAGECTSDDSSPSSRVLLSPGAMTKQIDATWAAGTNAGFRDSADTLTGTKTFHIYAFRRSNNTGDYFASTSLTPTLPDGGTNKRRLGSVVWNGSTLVAFTQLNDEFLWKDPPLDIDATNPGTTAVNRVLTVPTGIKVTALVNVLVVNGGTNASVYLSSLDVNDEAPSVSAGPLATQHVELTAGAPQNSGHGPVYVRTDTAATIRSRLGASGASTILRIATLGWVDRRGQDA